MHERIAAEIERIEKKYPNPMNRQEVDSNCSTTSATSSRKAVP